jgi:lysophospholipase L1-like esterase
MQTLEEEIRIRSRENMKADKRQRFVYLNRLAHKHEIVFAGSSLMEQFPINEFMITENIGMTIYNRGIGGYVTGDLLKSIDDCILNLEPKSVYLSIGTNDFNNPSVSVSDVMANIREIISRIRARLPECRIYFLALYPVNEDAASLDWVKKALKSRTNEKLNEANRCLRELTQEEKVGFIDCNTCLRDSQGRLKSEFTVDGIHMYANGYYEVFKELLPILRREEM